MQAKTSETRLLLPHKQLRLHKMADQTNSTSSSEYSDERAQRPAPGTVEFFNEMIYCTCEKCKNRKLKKRRLVGIHRLKYGVYREEALINHFNASRIMPEDSTRLTSTRMQPVNMEDPVMPSICKLATPNMTVGLNLQAQNIPLTSNVAAPRMRVALSMPTPNRTAPQLQSNPSCLDSIRIRPPTPEQVLLRSHIESQSKLLRILPDTLENIEVRRELLQQIQFCKKALLESAGHASDEREINVVLPDVSIGTSASTPTTATVSLVTTKGKQEEINVVLPDVSIGASASTPKTATVSLVTTKGKQEVTILLTSDGNVLKDEMGSKFFHFVFHRVEQLFGNTIQVDWRKQVSSKKDQLFENVIAEFGNPGFNKEYIMDIAQKYIHSKRDKLRSKLTKDLRYPRPAWITDSATWDELIEDAKFKRRDRNNPNYRPSAREGGKRRLRDTTKATQARLSSIGSHKLGSGGYNSIRGSLVNKFEKEASEEDLKYALLHGSQGLRQRMLDRGEKLVAGNESEEAQQSNSSAEAVDSEHEEALEAHDESVVAHNESTVVPEPLREKTPEFQQRLECDNEHVQHDEQTTSFVRHVPRRKRTKVCMAPMF